MRVRTQYIPMLVLFLAFVRADASMHPAATKAVTTHTHGHEALRGKEVSRPAKGANAPAEKHSVAARASSRKPQTVARLRPVPVKDTRLAARGRIVSSGRARPTETQRLAVVRAPVVAPKEAPAPHDSEPAEDTVHVTHDRKVHHTAEDEPRKATPADFMNDPAVAASDPATAAIPTPATAAAPKIATEPAADSAAAPAHPARQVRDQRAAPAAKAEAPSVKPAPAPGPVVMAALYTKGGRLIVPPALKGSHEILVRQNTVADQEGLSRVQDDVDLDAMRESRLLVALPKVQGLLTNEGLPENRRYCRPWTAQFLTALAKAHYAKFHRALQVNSAVRTVEVQERLLLTNGNAAPAEGQTASPHLTGQAVDLAKKGLSMTEIAWLRGYLLPLVQQGKVDVEEEFQQACFHVSVYKKYLPQPAPKREIAEGRRSAVSSLATAVR